MFGQGWLFCPLARGDGDGGVGMWYIKVIIDRDDQAVPTLATSMLCGTA
jgi:hypothetical protein